MAAAAVTSKPLTPAQQTQRRTKFRAYLLESTKTSQTRLISYLAEKIAAASKSKSASTTATATAAGEEDDDADSDIPLTEFDSPVIDLLSCVEQSLLFGIRWNAAEGWHGQARLWVCVRTRFQKLTPKQAKERSLIVSDFQSIEKSAELKENAIKVRAWLRLALNTNQLSEAIQLVFTETEITGKFFYDFALVMNSRQLTELIRITEALSRTHFRCRTSHASFTANAADPNAAPPGSVYRWELSPDGFPERNDRKLLTTANGDVTNSAPAPAAGSASGAIAIAGGAGAQSNGSRSSIGSLPSAPNSLIGSVGAGGRNSLILSGGGGGGSFVVGTPTGKKTVSNKNRRVIDDINEVFGEEGQNAKTGTAHDPLLVSPTHVKATASASFSAAATAAAAPVAAPLVGGLVPASHLKAVAAAATASPSTAPATATANAPANGLAKPDPAAATTIAVATAKAAATTATAAVAPTTAALDDVKKTLFFSEPRNKKKQTKPQTQPTPAPAPVPAPAPTPTPTAAAGASVPIPISPTKRQSASAQPAASSVSSAANSFAPAAAFGSLVSINAAPPLDVATANGTAHQPTANGKASHAPTSTRAGFGSDPPEPERDRTTGFGSLSSTRALELNKHPNGSATTSSTAATAAAPIPTPAIVATAPIAAAPAPTPVTAAVAPVVAPARTPEPTNPPPAATITTAAAIGAESIPATVPAPAPTPAAVEPTPAPAPVSVAVAVAVASTAVSPSITAIAASLERTVQTTTLALPPPEVVAPPTAPTAAATAPTAVATEPVPAAAASASTSTSTASMSAADKLAALQRIQEQAQAAIDALKRTTAPADTATAAVSASPAVTTAAAPAAAALASDTARAAANGTAATSDSAVASAEPPAAVVSTPTPAPASEPEPAPVQPAAGGKKSKKAKKTKKAKQTAAATAAAAAATAAAAAAATTTAPAAAVAAAAAVEPSTAESATSTPVVVPPTVVLPAPAPAATPIPASEIAPTPAPAPAAATPAPVDPAPVQPPPASETAVSAVAEQAIVPVATAFEPKAAAAAEPPLATAVAAASLTPAESVAATAVSVAPPAVSTAVAPPPTTPTKPAASPAADAPSTPTPPVSVAVSVPVSPVTPLPASATNPSTPNLDRDATQSSASIVLPAGRRPSSFHAAFLSDDSTERAVAGGANGNGSGGGFAAAHSTHSGGDNGVVGRGRARGLSDETPGASPPDSPHQNVRASTTTTPAKPTAAVPARAVTPPPRTAAPIPVSPGLGPGLIDGATAMKLDIRDQHFNAPAPAPVATASAVGGTTRLRSVTAAMDALDRRLGITPVPTTATAASSGPGAGAGASTLSKPATSQALVGAGSKQRTSRELASSDVAALTADIAPPSAADRGITFPAFDVQPSPAKVGAIQRNTPLKPATVTGTGAVQAAIPLSMNTLGLMGGRLPNAAPASAATGVDSKQRFASSGGVSAATVAAANKKYASASPYNSVTTSGSGGSGGVTGSVDPQSRGVHIRMNVTPIVKERSAVLLSRQGGLCASCNNKLVLGLFAGSSAANYCHYTGRLYCLSCFKGTPLPAGDASAAGGNSTAVADIDRATTTSSGSTDKAGSNSRVIPANLLHRLDVARYPVCRLAASYLDAVYCVPSFVLSNINPRVYDDSPALRFVRVLRIQLSHIKAFIYTCRKKEHLLRMFGTRTYMLHDLNTNDGSTASTATAATATAAASGNSTAADTKSKDDPSAGATNAAAAMNDLYSLRDLLEIVEGDFATRLHQVTRSIIHHISSGACEICASRAHICELCTDKVPIYPFQLQKTVQCRQCRACFHRKCFQPQTQACPRCVRVAKRREANSAPVAVTSAASAYVKSKK